MISACKPGTPTAEVDIFAGESKSQSMVRADNQGNIIDEVKCSDPRLNNYMAMSYDHFKKIYRVYILGCEKWKPCAYTDTCVE